FHFCGASGVGVSVAALGACSRMAHRASIGLTAAEGLQMALGRLQLFVVHLPLGISLFGASIALAVWAWMGQSAQTPSKAGTHGAASTFDRLKMEEKLWPSH